MLHLVLGRRDPAVVPQVTWQEDPPRPRWRESSRHPIQQHDEKRQTWRGCTRLSPARSSISSLDIPSRFQNRPSKTTFAPRARRYSPSPAFRLRSRGAEQCNPFVCAGIRGDIPQQRTVTNETIMATRGLRSHPNLKLHRHHCSRRTLCEVPRRRNTAPLRNESTHNGRDRPASRFAARAGCGAWTSPSASRSSAASGRLRTLLEMALRRVLKELGGEIDSPS